MERITANLTGKAARVRHNGREYLVAPMTLIVPGVLNGSKGALYYPPDEIAKEHKSWNTIPLVVYHPVVLGQHVSVNTPGVREKSEIGFARNAKIDPTTGKLQTQGWFDVERTRTVDNRVLQALQAGQPIELSTGLYTTNEPASPSANHNGKPYQFVAKDYKPDHIAILPDQVGACSLQDGCGVFNQETTDNAYTFGQSPNPLGQAQAVAQQVRGEGFDGPGGEEKPASEPKEAKEPAAPKTPKEPKEKEPKESVANTPGEPVLKPAKQARVGSAEAGSAEEEYSEKVKTPTPTENNAVEEVAAFLVYNAKWNQSARDALAKEAPEDFAGPHQSFPIKSQEDVDHAARLIGHADNPDLVKSKIKTIAERKGLALPDSWKGTTNAMPPVPQTDMSDDGQRQGFMAHLAGASSPESFRAAQASQDATKGGTAEEHLIAAHSHRVAAKCAKASNNPYLQNAHIAAANYHATKARSAPALQYHSTLKPTKESDLMKRKELEALAANCQCEETKKAITAVLNAKKKDEDDDEYMNNDDTNMHSFDGSGSGKGGSMQAGGKGTKDEYTGNKAIDQWLKESNAPPAVREIMANARRVEIEEKHRIVSRLVGNIADKDKRNQVGNRYMQKSLGELKEMELILPPVQNSQQQPQALYFGGAGAPDVTANANLGEAIPTTNIDYTEMASPHLLKKLSK